MSRRGKVIVQPITDEAKRRACQKKRLSGLLKKASELSTLCDAEVAAIVYGPDEAHPKYWPSDPNSITGTINKYLNRPEMERNSKQLDQKGFLRHMISKAKETEKQLKKKNEEKYAKVLISMLHEGELRPFDLDPEQSRKVFEFADTKAQRLRERIQYLRAKPPHPDGAGPSGTAGDGGCGGQMEIPGGSTGY